METIQFTCVLSDLLALFCGFDPLLMATLTQVCVMFNKRIGSCGRFLELLAKSDYFINNDFKEIVATYGRPSLRLRGIYASGFLHYAKYNGPQHSHYSANKVRIAILSVFLQVPRYNIQSLRSTVPTWEIEEIITEFDNARPLLQWGMDVEEIRNKLCYEI